MEQKFIDFLSKHELTAGLDESELLVLSKIVHVEQVATGKIVLSENDSSSDIYFLYEGEVGIFKWDKQKRYLLDIGKLSSKSIFGEMAFLDRQGRSTTIKVLKPSILLNFDPNELNLDDPIARKIYNTIVHNIAKINIARLRTSNQNYVQSLRTQIDFGLFFIVSIILFGIQSIIPLIVTDYGINVHTPVFSWSVALIILIPFLVMVRKFGYPIQEYGVGLKNFKKSFFQGLIIVATIILLLVSIYLILLKLNHVSTPLIQVLLNPKIVFTVSTLLYFFQVYIQEFIARGLTQTALQKFLNDDKGIKTVFIVSLVFGVFHLSRGFEAALVTFLGSVLFGFVYLRSRNLIGVTIVHYILGIIAIQYLGIV